MKQKEDRFWKFILKLVGGKSIRKQLYSFYYVAMVFPILILGVILVTGTYQLLTNYHMDLMNSDNARVKNLMFEFTTQVRNLSENVIFDDAIQEVLTGEAESPEDFRKEVNHVEILDSYKSTYVEISDIEIYSDNPSVVDYKQFKQPGEAVIQKEWYQKALIQSGAFWTGMTKETTSGISSHFLCLVRKIPLIDSPYHAILVMWISDDYLRSSIENSSFETYISAGRENVFYSSDRSVVGSAMPVDINYNLAYFQDRGRIAKDGKVWFSQISTLNTYQSESKIYICTVNKDGYYQIWHILLICFVILGLSIVIPGLLIFVYTHYLTGRIELLRKEMHKASQQDYELIPVIHGEDEISEAHADLQIMVENIKEHEALIYESQIKEQQIESRQLEMEYKMLASQINPHFLYNTLETIRMKAFTAGDKEVAGAIKLLGKSMRYVLENTGMSETTLSKELEHVKVYLDIQMLRFEERFDYTLQIEEGLNPEQIRILPLLLQPLVENSMVHGLENVDENGHLLIRIHKGELNGKDMLFIDVSDNGNGMAPETLEQLRSDIEVKDVSRSKSIGLYNINQRVKLLYGEESSLRIDSVLGEGTTVRLSLPAKKCVC